MLKLADYIKGIETRDISILARAITLCESQKKEHQELAIELLSKLKVNKNALILGISGTPGVGKSTFIEAFGMELIKRNLKVAVLAVDPTSEVTGGSILGDKTRMNELSTKAFIRPSPSGKTLGGVTNKTREAIQLCEAYGFDIIIVETVGVGQSEAQVSKLVDQFLLLMQPGAGDDLQAIKRGILELADYLIVNKADGELLTKAKLTKSQLESSLEILRHKKMPIHLISSLKKEGITELIESLLSEKKDYTKKRLEQRSEWVDQLLDQFVINELKENNNFQQKKSQLKEEIIKNQKTLDDAQKEIKTGLKYGS